MAVRLNYASCLADDDHRAEANSEEQAGLLSDRGYRGVHASHDQGMVQIEHMLFTSGFRVLIFSIN